MGPAHWGDPAGPPGQQQGRYPKVAGPSPARLHRGPWQTSPGGMEATVDRGAGTQSMEGVACQSERLRNLSHKGEAVVL